MTNLDDLNEFEPNREHGFEINSNRPQWFKLWAEKYATALDIEHLSEDLSPEELGNLFFSIGKVFINALFYFFGHDEGHWKEYKPQTRDERVLWNALKRDIDQSYRDYDKRVENGSKGGRPKKDNQP